MLLDGKIGLLDCGMVGYIDKHIRNDLEEMLMAAIIRKYRILLSTGVSMFMKVLVMLEGAAGCAVAAGLKIYFYRIFQ